jgi:hypothetical protein
MSFSAAETSRESFRFVFVRSQSRRARKVCLLSLVKIFILSSFRDGRVTVAQSMSGLEEITRRNVY